MQDARLRFRTVCLAHAVTGIDTSMQPCFISFEPERQHKALPISEAILCVTHMPLGITPACRAFAQLNKFQLCAVLFILRAVD